jgi:hypothetical protein
VGAIYLWFAIGDSRTHLRSTKCVGVRRSEIRKMALSHMALICRHNQVQSTTSTRAARRALRLSGQGSANTMTTTAILSCWMTISAMKSPLTVMEIVAFAPGPIQKPIHELRSSPNPNIASIFHAMLSPECVNIHGRDSIPNHLIIISLPLVYMLLLATVKVLIELFLTPSLVRFDR